MSVTHDQVSDKPSSDLQESMYSVDMMAQDMMTPRNPRDLAESMLSMSVLGRSVLKTNKSDSSQFLGADPSLGVSVIKHRTEDG